jgi:hypothetical protein
MKSVKIHCVHGDKWLPVLPDLCKPSRPALPLTLLVYGGDRGHTGGRRRGSREISP